MSAQNLLNEIQIEPLSTFFAVNAGDRKRIEIGFLSLRPEMAFPTHAAANVSAMRHHWVLRVAECDETPGPLTNKENLEITEADGASSVSGFASVDALLVSASAVISETSIWRELYLAKMVTASIEFQPHALSVDTTFS